MHVLAAPRVQIVASKPILSKDCDTFVQLSMLSLFTVSDLSFVFVRRNKTDSHDYERMSEVTNAKFCLAKLVRTTRFRGGGGDRSQPWDRETMFSQLAKRSSQNVDSGVRHNKYFRSTINLFEIVFRIYVYFVGEK